MSNRFSGRDVLRSALLVTASTYISYAAGLIVSMVVARHLGPRDYGHYAYLIWLSGTLTVLICNGLTLTAIRFVSESFGRADTGEANRVQRLLRSWYFASIAIVSVTYVAVSPWVAPNGWDKPGWWFVAAALIAAIGKADSTLGASVSKGYGRFEVEAYTMNLLSLASLAGVVLLALSDAPLEAYMVLFVVLSVGYAISTRILMGRAGIHVSDDPVDDVLRKRIQQQYMWTALLFMIFALSNKSVENLLLNTYVGPEAVGWFAIAAAMTRGGVDLLTSGLNTVLLPMLSRAVGANDHDHASSILSDAMRYFFFLGVTLAGVGVLWAEPAITLLYGQQYMPAVIGLQVMMLIGGMLMPEAATAALLITTDRQTLRVALAISSLTITIVTAYALIPHYGFEGALASHFIARVTIFIASAVIITRFFGIRLPYNSFVRTLAAASIAACLAAAVLFYSRSIPAQLVAGAVYGLSCICGSVAFGVWTKHDVSTLHHFTNRLPGLRLFEQILMRFAR